MDIKTQIDSELRVRLLAMQNNRSVGTGNIPKLSKPMILKFAFFSWYNIFKTSSS